jgi:hypothetical protein
MEEYFFLVINIHMSMCYIQLPEFYKIYIKDNILETLYQAEKSYPVFSRTPTHSQFRVPMRLVLTKEGINRFANYWPLIHIFKLVPNSVSVVHIDNSYHAFNFIVTNNGYMEWFDQSKLEVDCINMHGVKTYKFSEEAVIDRADCNMMWVNTKIPHRVVNNTDQERWGISIRTLRDTPYPV